MIILGLTGSIAMGKSTVAKMLRQLKVPVHDADQAVHSLLQQDHHVIEALSKLFPDAYHGGYIHRKDLSAYVVKDPGNLKKIEKILHPRVKDKTLSFIHRHFRKKTPVICLDIPLLFEKEIDRNPDYGIDFVVTVSAPHFIQHSRLMARPNMTADKIKVLTENQMSDHQKRKKSDFIIETGLSKAYTLKQIRKILSEIQII